MGAQVIVTAGTDEKCAACLALGADHAINYRSQDFAAEVMRLTGRRGAHVVLDMVAGGGYAEFCVAPAGQCLPVPQGLNMVQAASLPETFFTVWQNVFDIAALQAGETLLVQGGSSLSLIHI